MREWTADGILRHPSFQGLREDKSPEEVVYDRLTLERLVERQQIRKPRPRVPPADPHPPAADAPGPPLSRCGRGKTRCSGLSPSPAIAGEGGRA